MNDQVKGLTLFLAVAALAFVVGLVLGRRGAINEYRSCRAANTAEQQKFACPGWMKP